MQQQNAAAGCPYCEQGQKLNSFAYPVCSLGTTELYLFREQSHPGRCLLVLGRHAEEYTQLTLNERQGVQQDLYRVTCALEALFHPDKINLGVFGDTVRHFHIHVVPKYVGGPDWGGMFQMDLGAVRPDDRQLEARAQALRAQLGA